VDNVATCLVSSAGTECPFVRLLAQVSILLLSLPPPPLLLSHNVKTPLPLPPLLLLLQLSCCSDQLQNGHFRAVTTAQHCLWLDACVSTLTVTIALCIEQQDKHTPQRGFSCSSQSLVYKLHSVKLWGLPQACTGFDYSKPVKQPAWLSHDRGALSVPTGVRGTTAVAAAATPADGPQDKVSSTPAGQTW